MKDAKRQERRARMHGATRIPTSARMKVQRLLFRLMITSLPACTPMIMSQDMENKVHAQVAMSLSRFSHEKPVNCNSEDLYEALGVTRRLAYGFTQMEYRMWAGELMMASYEVIGTKGKLRVDRAYEYVMPLKHYLTIDGKTKTRTFARRDQFAPELLYFSDCILKNIDPEPSGEEGLADVRTVRALYRAAKIGRPIKIRSVSIKKRPTLKQEKHRPPVVKPKLIHVESASA
jgi:hypothetical protein